MHCRLRFPDNTTIERDMDRVPAMCESVSVSSRPGKVFAVGNVHTEIGDAGEIATVFLIEPTGKA